MDDGLCRIHATFGMQAKPLVCQQFPILAVRVDDEVRVGIDPGCYTHITTWQSGPEVDASKLVVSKPPLPEAQRPVEERLVDLLSLDGLTLGRALAQLTGEPPAADGGPSHAFRRRLLRRLRDSGVVELYAGAKAAPAMREGLAPLFETLDDLDPEAPWSLSPEADAYALDATRRMIWLRIAATQIPVVIGVALLTLSGATALALATDDDDTFGAGLAAWVRSLRHPQFWTRLAVNSEMLEWLARGGDADPPA